MPLKRGLPPVRHHGKGEAVVTSEQCRALIGHVVQLRVAPGTPFESTGFRCQVMAVERQNGEEVVRVQTAAALNIDVTLPISLVVEITDLEHRVRPSGPHPPAQPPEAEPS